MDKLSIDEVIEHCNRTCEKFEMYSMMLKEEITNKQYAEHYYVSEWLKELNGFRNIGLTPKQLLEVDKLYTEKCEELSYSEKYIKWLENMTILLSKCYQETHDNLLKKLQEDGNKAYFEMPTVQGFSMVMTVDKISQKATNHGNITDELLDGYTNYLIERNQASLAETEGKNE